MLLGTLALLAAGHAAPAAHARAAQTPDIKVTTVSPTKTRTEAGWGLSLRATVRNAGGGTTQAGVVRFSLSKDRSAGGGDVKLPPNVPVSGLSAGQQVILPPELTVPPKTAAGKYYVIACAVVPGKDHAKGNDCATSKKRVQVDAAIQGRLTGTIDFSRSTADGGSDWSETSSDQASVNVDVRVDGRKKGWDIFASTGSTWTYQGSYERISHPDGCEVTILGSSAGSGTVRQTGDQYEDDLLGSFKVEDHSRISLLIGLRYDYTERTRQVPTEQFGCTPSDETVGPKALRSLAELDLRKVQQTKKAIVYKVAGARDPYSTKSTWDSVTGRLTLELR